MSGPTIDGMPVLDWLNAHGRGVEWMLVCDDPGSEIFMPKKCGLNEGFPVVWVKGDYLEQERCEVIDGHRYLSFHFTPLDRRP